MNDRPLEVRDRDLLLNALTAASGAVDTISFLALGKVFSAFMTGNIAFLGMRAAGAATAPGVVDLLSSLLSFVVGAYLAARIVKSSEGSKVWPRGVTVALAVSLIGQVVFIALWVATSGKPSADAEHALLGSWAFASGMQAGAVRTLGVEGVISTAATGTVLGFAADMVNWSTTRSERRRFATVLVSLFLGAAAGGLLLVHTPLYAPLLPLVITVVVVAIAATRFSERGGGTGPSQSV